MKTMIVGLAPSPRDPAAPPLVRAASGRRIAKFMELSTDELAETFELHNLLLTPPPSDARERREALAAGSARVKRLVRPGQRVILLGKDVTQAWRFDGFPPYRFERWDPAPWVEPHYCAWAHHPSGKSRFWNDPASMERARLWWLGVGRKARSAESPTNS